MGTKAEEKPVFIAGAGPRTGTTLVQRIINAHPDAWIWGEIGKSLEELWAQSWDNLDASRALFEQRDQKLYMRHARGDKLVSEWVASFMPSRAIAIEAYRAFFLTLLRTKRIWGFKTVSCSHLDLMRTLFPSAKIIITLRPPLDQYSSYVTGIAPGSSPDEAVKTLKERYKACLAHKKPQDLILDLASFDPETWVEAIYAHIDEPIPDKAMIAARAKIRGPVPPPLETVEPEIKQKILRELEPFYRLLSRHSHPT